MRRSEHEESGERDREQRAAGGDRVDRPPSGSTRDADDRADYAQKDDGDHRNGVTIIETAFDDLPRHVDRQEEQFRQRARREILSQCAPSVRAEHEYEPERARRREPQNARRGVACKLPPATARRAQQGVSDEQHRGGDQRHQVRESDDAHERRDSRGATSPARRSRQRAHEQNDTGQPEMPRPHAGERGFESDERRPLNQQQERESASTPRRQRSSRDGKERERRRDESEPRDQRVGNERTQMNERQQSEQRVPERRLHRYQGKSAEGVVAPPPDAAAAHCARDAVHLGEVGRVVHVGARAAGQHRRGENRRCHDEDNQRDGVVPRESRASRVGRFAAHRPSGRAP